MIKSSLIRKLFSRRHDQSPYLSLIDRIAAVAHSSLDLKRAVTISAEEVGRALGASRCAVVLLHENELRFAAEYSAPDISPRIKNQLGPIDQELTLNMADEASLKEIPDLASDPALAALFLFSFNEDPGSSNVRSVLVAPLVTRSQVIGAIIIYRARGTGWTSQEKQFVQAIASSLSLTIYHIDIQEKAKNAADRESLINSMLTAIRTADSVDKILDVAVEGVGAALGVTRAIISMRPRALNGGRMALVAHAEYRASALVPSLLGSSLDIEHSPLLARLLEGELITIPDINDSHPFVRAICVRLGVRAMALAPISYNGQMVAIFALEQFDRPREFSEEEIRLLRLAAEQTAVALYQADLYREAQEAARRDALISKISSAIHSSLDSDTVLQAIVNELGAALSVCRCRVALVPDPVPEFVSITHEYIAECCAGHRGVTQSVPMAQNPYFRAVFSSERPIAVNDLSIVR